MYLGLNAKCVAGSCFGMCGYKFNVCISQQRPSPMKVEQAWSGLYPVTAAAAVILLMLIFSIVPLLLLLLADLPARCRLACAK
jgi:hypothetical protein